MGNVVEMTVPVCDIDSEKGVNRFVDELRRIGVDIVHDADGTSMKRLESEKDVNVLITAGGRKLVVKIFNSESHPNDIELMMDVMGFVARWLSVPRVIYSSTAESLLFEGKYKVCVLEYLEGSVIASSPIDGDLFRKVGTTVGILTNLLHKYSVTPPDMARESRLIWHYSNFPSVVANYAGHVSDTTVRSFIHQMAFIYDSRTHDLPTQMCHSDGNLDNLLVLPSTEEFGILGVIDFGDVDWGFRIADISIALCYLVGATFSKPIHSNDDVKELVRMAMSAYLAEVQITSREVEAIGYLVLVRSAMSLCIQSLNRTLHPENADYLSVSMSGNLALLTFAMSAGINHFSSLFIS